MAHFIRDFVVRWQRVVSSALTTPNPGFARAVLSLEVVVTIVGYFIVSDSHATLKQGLGMVAILWVRLRSYLPK
jgi:hypothetical protein